VAEGEEPPRAVKDLAASFQDVVIRSLVGTTERLAAEHRPRTLIVAGGVACNEALRQASRDACGRLGIPAYFPSRHLSTDNAAMIAAAGAVKLQAGMSDGLDLDADVSLRLQNLGVEDDTRARGRVHYRL
jgi:N6-L-threonylcarbamoyladenine synthase